MGSLVSLVRANGSEDLAKSVDHAVGLLDFKIAGSVRSVVVKPNLCYYWDASTGYTTDPRLVSGVAFDRSASANKISRGVPVRWSSIQP